MSDNNSRDRLPDINWPTPRTVPRTDRPNPLRPDHTNKFDRFRPGYTSDRDSMFSEGAIHSKDPNGPSASPNRQPSQYNYPAIPTEPSAKRARRERSFLDHTKEVWDEQTRLEAEVKDLRAKLRRRDDALQAEKQSAEQTKENFKREVERRTAMLECQARDEKEANNREHETLKVAEKELRRKHAEEVDQIKKQTQDCVKELQTVIRERDFLNSKMEECMMPLATQIAELEKLVEDNGLQIDRLKADVEERDQEIVQLKGTQIFHLRKVIEEREQEITQLKNEAEQHEKKDAIPVAEDTNASHAAFLKQIEELEKVAREARGDANGRQRIIDDLRKKHTTADESSKLLKTRNNALENQLKSVQQEVRKLRKDAEKTSKGTQSIIKPLTPGQTPTPTNTAPTQNDQEQVIAQLKERLAETEKAGVKYYKHLLEAVFMFSEISDMELADLGALIKELKAIVRVSDGRSDWFEDFWAEFRLLKKRWEEKKKRIQA